MNAKEAYIIQEAGIGPIIKQIRKAVESKDYNNYMSIGPYYLTDGQKHAFRDLGYRLSPYLDMDNTWTGGVMIEWG